MYANQQVRRGSTTLAFAALVFVTTAAVAICVIVVVNRPSSQPDHEPVPEGGLDDPLSLHRPRLLGAPEELLPEEQRTVRVFREVAPSVVHVDAMGIAPELRHANEKLPPGIGSGFVWSDRGYIVTSLHVVEGRGPQTSVTLADGTKWPAMFVGADPEYDIAVLAVSAPAEHLHPIELGTSSSLQVGQRVFAIGNPFGLDHTLTVGVVSGLDRSIQGPTTGVIHGTIQTDAAINPGNSGGPLLNSSGQLIGINTAMEGSSPASAKVGFAVPVDVINDVVPVILDRGMEVWSELGIVLAPDELSIRILGASGWLQKSELDFGVVVIEVHAGSSAAAAGVLPVLYGHDVDAGVGRVTVQDVIVGVDGLALSSRDQLSAQLGLLRSGDSVRLELRREGVPMTLELGLPPH